MSLKLVSDQSKTPKTPPAAEQSLPPRDESELRVFLERCRLTLSGFKGDIVPREGPYGF